MRSERERRRRYVAQRAGRGAIVRDGAAAAWDDAIVARTEVDRTSGCGGIHQRHAARIVPHIDVPGGVEVGLNADREWVGRFAEDESVFGEPFRVEAGVEVDVGVRAFDQQV